MTPSQAKDRDTKKQAVLILELSPKHELKENTSSLDQLYIDHGHHLLHGHVLHSSVRLSGGSTETVYRTFLERT